MLCVEFDLHLYKPGLPAKRKPPGRVHVHRGFLPTERNWDRRARLDLDGLLADVLTGLEESLVLPRDGGRAAMLQVANRATKLAPRDPRIHIRA